MDNARRHPYQCLALRSGTPERSNVLLAAAGAHIFSIDLASGTTIDTWPEPKQVDLQYPHFLHGDVRRLIE